MSGWTTRFTALWRRSKRPKAASSGVAVSKPPKLVEWADYLLALDRLQAVAPDAYLTVLDWHRGQLLECWRTQLTRPVDGQELIALVAVSRDSKARTIAGFVDDMEKTVDKITHPNEAESEYDDTPSGVLAGS